MINIIQVNKNFGDLEVLKNININFKEGKTTVILGASGSGKSTLLRSINRLVEIDSGTISIKNISLDQISNKDLYSNVGMVFQQFNLFQNMTVIENVMYALKKVKKYSKSEAHEKALRELEKVSMQDKIEAYPRHLSGGQQQRVALARALVLQPSIMLFDEPTSALDPETVNEVLVEMKKLTKTGLTNIIVTHEIGFAKEVADYIVFMDKGEIIEEGKTSDFFNQPKTKRAKEFLEKIL